MTGIEPAPSVWKTEALPLSYIPAGNFFSLDVSASADDRFSKDGEPARLYEVVSPVSYTHLTLPTIYSV